jgi:hypothetical protein
MEVVAEGSDARKKALQIGEGDRRGDPEVAGRRRRWGRDEAAEALQVFEEALEVGLGERDAAEKAGAPRSTARKWVVRREALDVPRAVAEFLESPEGSQWVRGIVIAALFVVGVVSPGGLRGISLFFRLSGLDSFVASSFGSVQKAVAQLEKNILDFGEKQGADLGARMTPKRISLAEDETFHPDICLVAIEPVSDFIVVEEYAPDRKAETWTAAVKRGLQGLPVTVVQGTSDEAKAIKAHIEDVLGAHHSPDLFHVQHEVCKAVSLPLARRVEQASTVLTDAKTTTERAKAAKLEYESEKHGPGRPPDLAGRITLAEQAEAVALQRLDQAIDDQDNARKANVGISMAYHPYSLVDGAARSPEQVDQELRRELTVVDAVAASAGLKDKARAGIAKAGRVVQAMVATIAFSLRETKALLDAADLPADLRTDLEERLVPGLYLQSAAGRAPTAAKRLSISTAADTLLAPLRSPDHLLQNLEPKEAQRMWNLAQACADIFQRSSSCVEGRNGHLSLYHHGLHRLPERKLRALTTVHNYFARRADGTTAAQRFFGAPHSDLFEYLLATTPSLPRPAVAKRLRARGPRPDVRQAHGHATAGGGIS